MKHKFKTLILAVVDEFRDPYYQASAAQLAFFLFLSILPMVTLFSSILGIFDLSLADIIAWSHINMAPDILETLSTYFVEGSKSKGISILLLITTLWAASRAQFTLAKISDYAFRYNQGQVKSMFQRRFRAYLFVLFVIVLFVLLLVGIIYGQSVLDLIFGKDVINTNSWLFIGIRWVVIFVLYLILISIFYITAPSKRPQVKEVLPGSMFAAIGFVLATLLYTVYAKLSINTSVIYGSLSSIVFLMLWFWVISWIFLVGVVLNKKCVELNRIFELPSEMRKFK